MGIAGDDLEDVLKYGAAGGALGYSIAPGVGRRIANSNLAQSIKSGNRKSNAWICKCSRDSGTNE